MLDSSSTESVGQRGRDRESRALDATAVEISRIRSLLQHVAEGQETGDSLINKVREIQADHVKMLGRYPVFLDVGINAFMDVYDWHIRHRLPIHIVKMAEQRFAIQFVATQLVVRWELPDLNYIGRPRDI